MAIGAHINITVIDTPHSFSGSFSKHLQLWKFMKNGMITVPAQFDQLSGVFTPEQLQLDALQKISDNPKSRNQERREELAKFPSNRNRMRY